MIFAMFFPDADELPLLFALGDVHGFHGEYVHQARLERDELRDLLPERVTPRPRARRGTSPAPFAPPPRDLAMCRSNRRRCSKSCSDRAWRSSSSTTPPLSGGAVEDSPRARREVSSVTFSAKSFACSITRSKCSSASSRSTSIAASSSGRAASSAMESSAMNGSGGGGGGGGIGSPFSSNSGSSGASGSSGSSGSSGGGIGLPSSSSSGSGGGGGGNITSSYTSVHTAKSVPRAVLW